MASLSPELITTIGGFPITNTIIATVIVDAVIITIAILIARKITPVPNKLQNAVESLFSYFFDLARSMAGKRAMAIFPWVMTFFLFIVLSNFLGLMPGIGSIGIYETTPAAVSANNSQDTHESSQPADSREDDAVAHSEGGTAEEISTTMEKEDTPGENLQANESAGADVPHGKEHLVALVRPATSDFNATLALATISLFATHILSIRFTGLKDYLSRFFVINPIMLFVGLLELVSEFIKIFSLSFRLFGNIYAGEVVLATISGLFAFLAPLPFLLLESIVAIVQALVFAMLTLVFMSMFTQKHHSEEH